MFIFRGFIPAVLGISFYIIINFFSVIIKKSDYDIKKLIMMQKLEPRIAGPKHTETGHVDTGQSNCLIFK